MPHTNALLESNEIIPNIIASRQRQKSVDYLENERSDVSLENKGYRSAIADVSLENKRSGARRSRSRFL
ncbi:hypothetical protein [Helicobacter sp.]|uniref:hypothetical protein n=1 Tax=Helicobacter sp. TaxID=218 RepID=UPI0025C0240D|nr:hypothetical protein [Helicobacter sp.]MBR2494956.1 hypothetical protein [Helicobacter sp.]